MPNWTNIRNIITFIQTDEPLTATVGDIWVVPGTAYKRVCIEKDSGGALLWKDLSSGEVVSGAVFGGLWSWGYNEYGQLGDETTVNKSSPIQIGNLTTWKSVDGGYGHTIAIKTDGTFWSWGYNNKGQLGDGTTTYKSSPIQVGNLTNWKFVDCGWYHTTAIK